MATTPSELCWIFGNQLPYHDNLLSSRYIIISCKNEDSYCAGTLRGKNYNHLSSNKDSKRINNNWYDWNGRLLKHVYWYSV